ncbi:MAG TPA: hypothetical protein VGB83_08085 [Actinomycetota bacterium]
MTTRAAYANRMYRRGRRRRMARTSLECGVDAAVSAGGLLLANAALGFGLGLPDGAAGIGAGVAMLAAGIASLGRRGHRRARPALAPTAVAPVVELRPAA